MTKGARPLAPLGRHSSQSGVLLDRVVAPVAEELPEAALPDVVLPLPFALDGEPDPAPPVEADPVAEPPVIVAVGAAEFVATGVPAALVIVGSVTAP